MVPNASMHLNIQHFYDDTTPHTTLFHQGHCDAMTTSCPDTPPSLHQRQEHDHQLQPLHEEEHYY